MMSNPYYPFKKTARERFSERISRFRERARREAPAVAKRSAKRAAKGFAKAGTDFARNASFNISSGQQQRHWDSLNDAIMGHRGSTADSVSNAILGIRPRKRSRSRSSSVHIHIHGQAAPRKRKKRGDIFDPFSL